MTYKTTRIRLLPILMALFLVVAGCDSNDDGGDGDDNQNPFGNGSMEATVDGNSFDAALVIGIFQNGIVSVTGNLGATQAATQEQINLTIPNASEGSFQVNPISGVSAVYATGSLTGADGWVGMSGTITIDNLSDNGVSGTFSFTGQNNAQQTISVTGGEFSVAF